MREEAGLSPDSVWGPLSAAARERVRRALGDAVYTRAIQEGGRLSAAHAAELARADLPRVARR
jgi:hypothetical protein